MMDVETIAYQPPALATYSRGLKIQANVIGALLMRELHTRYGRDNVGYLWMFGEPMILATAVASLHAAQKSHDGSDMAMIPFAIAGYTLFIMFRGMINRAEGTLEANMPLLYHRSVSIFDMMFARAVLEGISTFATFLILICGAYALGLADLPARPFDLLLGAFLMFWWSAAISFIICAVTHDNMLVGASGASGNIHFDAALRCFLSTILGARALSDMAFTVSNVPNI